MASMKIMAPVGHTTVTWGTGSDTDLSVEEVREKFDELIAEGYIASDQTERPGTIVQDFPETATDILVFPAMAGGSR